MRRFIIGVLLKLAGFKNKKTSNANDALHFRLFPYHYGLEQTGDRAPYGSCADCQTPCRDCKIDNGKDKQ